MGTATQMLTFTIINMTKTIIMAVTLASPDSHELDEVKTVAALHFSTPV